MSAADYLRAIGVTNVSENGARCAELVEAWFDGMPHIPSSGRGLRKGDWGGDYVTFTMYGGLASFDFSTLTRLVFLAHDHAIRAEVTPAMRYLRITLSPRTREATMITGHPTLEEAVAMHRKRFPKESERTP